MPPLSELNPEQIGTLQILDQEAMPGTDRRLFLTADELFEQLYGDDGTINQLRNYRTQLPHLVRFGYVRSSGMSYIITSPGQAWLALHKLDQQSIDTADDLTPEQERIRDLERLVRLLWASRRHHQETRS